MKPEYLLINKTELTVTRHESLDAVAELAGTTVEELENCLDLPGRWDGENGEHCVIVADPEEKEIDA